MYKMQQHKPLGKTIYGYCNTYKKFNKKDLCNGAKLASLVILATVLLKNMEEHPKCCSLQVGPYRKNIANGGLVDWRDLRDEQTMN